MKFLRGLLALVIITMASSAGATTFTRDDFSLASADPNGVGYTVGQIHGQGYGVGWATGPQVQGTLCTSTSNTAIGGGKSGATWVDGYSVASSTANKIAANFINGVPLFSYPGIDTPSGFLHTTKSNSDIRGYRSIDLTNPALASFLSSNGRIGAGTIYIGLMMRLNTPPPATGFCGVHLRDTLPGPLTTCPAGKVGERTFYGDRNLNVQTGLPSSVYNFGRTTQASAGAAIFDTTIQMDGTPRLVVVRIRFNTASTCTNGVNGAANCKTCPLDPVTHLPTLCNEEVTMWIDPPAGPVEPAIATISPKNVQDFTFDAIDIGSGQGSTNGQEGCDFAMVAIESSYADLFVLPQNDTCLNAEVLDVEPDLPVDVFGSTIGAVDDYTTFCADTTVATDHQDVVYQLNVAAPGTLYMSLDDGLGIHPLNGALELRVAACANETNKGNERTLCSNINTTGAGEFIATDVFVGTYWVVVDTAGTTPGDFVLSASLTAASCGDGVVNESAGEECEPTSSNDPGCYGPGDNTPCMIKSAPVQLETCPGMPMTIAGGESVVWGPFDTAGALDNAIGSCFGTPPHANTQGTDQVLQVTPSASGTLTLTIGVDPATGVAWCSEPSTCWANNVFQGVGCMSDCWAGAIYARTTCADAATELACDWAYSSAWDGPTPTYFAEHISFSVTSGTPYWVFIDGISKPSIPHSAGPYYVEASLQ